MHVVPEPCTRRRPRSHVAVVRSCMETPAPSPAFYTLALSRTPHFTPTLKLSKDWAENRCQWTAYTACHTRQSSEPDNSWWRCWILHQSFYKLTKAERVCFRNTNRRIRRRSSGWTEDIASIHSAALGFQYPHLKANRTPTIISIHFHAKCKQKHGPHPLVCWRQW